MQQAVESKGGFCGKPLEDMTREELIDALVCMDKLFKEAQGDHLHQLDTLAFLRRFS